MSKTAIILVEGRGEAVHLREDAGLNLLQAAFIARELIDHDWRVIIRVILDPGQSICEYSLLCHAGDETIARYRAAVELSATPRTARYAVVREIRETLLPFTVDAKAIDGVAVEDRLFFAALLARITGVNEEVLARVRATQHPLIDGEGTDEYERLLRAHVGGAYLDFEEAIACWTVRRCLGDAFDEVAVSAISRAYGGPQRWLNDPLCSRVVRDGIAAQERGEGGEDFRSRLIGLFTPVFAHGEERPYFNSPTCCRREHGKVRIMSRDRFDILGLRASERMPFDRLRELLDEQDAGRGTRPFALKYPYTARYIAGSVAQEAVANAGGDDAVQVIFVEGIDGNANAGTGLLVDSELRALLPPSIAYHHFSARQYSAHLLPNAPGALPMIADRLWERIETTFPDSFDRDALTRRFAAPSPASGTGTLTHRPPGARDAQLPV
jgi:hypothetical protein